MTRVRIVGNERQGTIEIVYANAEELERLTAIAWRASTDGPCRPNASSSE